MNFIVKNDGIMSNYNMNMTQKHQFPTYFISHGGGPWPYMKNEMGSLYDSLEQSLVRLSKSLQQKPKAILMISGHWEETHFTVMSNALPPMIYDYSGFPEHTYQIQYKAPGSPELAKRVQELLQKSNIPCELDAHRGFDHGTFTPMAVMYPNADIPTIQLSMKKNYSAKQHLEMGRALAPLREEGVLIIGSGLSYHNLRQFVTPTGFKASAEFDQWLQNTMKLTDFSERSKKLEAWEQAPSARIAHPREDHFIPLMVAVGAAENEKAELIYHENNFMGGLWVSSYRIGVEI